MSVMLCADIFQTLGLGWQKILLYLANFLVLFIGLFFLLYKPIKKFMDKRKQQIADEVAAAENIKKETEEIAKSGLERAKTIEEDAKKVVAEAEEERLAAEKESEAIVADARLRADKIISEAEETAKEERNQALRNAKNDVADIALTVASEILGREITQKDNDKLIDDCIKEWQNND